MKGSISIMNYECVDKAISLSEAGRLARHPLRLPAQQPKCPHRTAKFLGSGLGKHDSRGRTRQNLGAVKRSMAGHMVLDRLLDASIIG